ncbi:unnamed protein product [Linum trigynum]|uniref:non-specific serine/threonine protein kinase n=1 Tax=Linum trigynum TaxID=586398 RepID=A0AAV2D899_9ROSI
MSFLRTSLFFILLLPSIAPLCSSAITLKQQNATSPCPFNFNPIKTLIAEINPTNRTTQCRVLSNGILLLRSRFLRSTGKFLPPPAVIQACRRSYQNWIGKTHFRGLNIESDCGRDMEAAFGSCGNITTRIQFETRFPKSELRELESFCNDSLENRFPCRGCAHKFTTLAELHFPPGGHCARNYMLMYVSAFLTNHGPGHASTVKCFFRLRQSNPVAAAIPSQNSRGRRRWMVAFAIFGYVLGALAVVMMAVSVTWVVRRKCRCSEVKSTVVRVVDEQNESCETSIDLGSESRRRNITKFSLSEIREATMNFSRENIIGQGCYGNVYRGTLQDGTGVAVKRFKNSSRSSFGDETFAHEVEIIASVKHVNLLALRGYCVTRAGQKSKQRIIVSDLMRNGSVHDHLFLPGGEKCLLPWPIRLKIALGTARGLAYLHYGVHPAIIHRDIKASNILLDELFEPKLADFGLARFDDSQGRTHLSTGAAGTLGYVAPEYALYGRLTEKSDVYSFGVVLLELLSGHKAYELVDDDDEEAGEVRLLGEWAWRLVQQQEGDAIEVVEKGLSGSWPGPMMERFVHLAVICAHPVEQARPTMEQVVKILEKFCDGEEYDLACTHAAESSSDSYTRCDEISSDRDPK